LLERSIELFQEAGATHPAARVAARLGRALWVTGDLTAGAERLEKAFRTLADDEPDADLAALAAQLGRLRFFLGEFEAAGDRVERALEIAESLSLPEVLAEALNTKHLLLTVAGRHEEALALLQRAHAIALEHDLGPALQRTLINLSYQFATRDEHVAAKEIDLEGLTLCRRRGDRDTEATFLEHMLAGCGWLGEWDEVARWLIDVDQVVADEAGRRVSLSAVPCLCGRGEVAKARRLVEAAEGSAASGDVQERVLYLAQLANVLRAEGRTAESLAAAESALVERGRLSDRHPAFKLAFAGAVEAAFDNDDLDRVSEILDESRRMRPVDRTPFIEAQHARFGARLAVRRGDDKEFEEDHARAEQIFRELSTPFYLAVSLLEHAEWLAERGRAEDAAPFLAEAREIFERLGAKPWLERLAAGETKERARVSV
jgi:tetratricopeptide (TPR) repeat protein